MENILTEDYERRVIRLLERIEAKRQLVSMYRKAIEPSLLMIEESTDMLQRYVNELDMLLHEHGLSVQLKDHEVA